MIAMLLNIIISIRHSRLSQKIWISLGIFNISITNKWRKTTGEKWKRKIENPPSLLLPCFSFLSPHNFISIFDTLSFVWFWGSPFPNRSSKLANLRFVKPTNCDSGVFFHLHFEANRDFHLNRMRKSKIQHHFVSFYHSTITDTNKLKLLFKTFRYSNNQVVCKCPVTFESSMNIWRNKYN